ncbi:MAG: 16S rRNA (cytosine(967)-C(5))-methyltransferase RsmB [Bacillota bacterium]
MSNPSGRNLAQLVLDRIEQRASYINLALPEVLDEFPEADRREKAFCTELVYGVYRHLLKIDYFLGRLLCRPLSSLKIPVKNSLRIALYQLLYLPEIPERAVCYSAVEQIKNSRYQGLAPLVNGVLRAYLRNKNNLAVPEKEPGQYLSIEYSHPRWLVERWLERFGPELTVKILTADNELPPLTLRVNRHSAAIAAVLQELKTDGAGYSPGNWLAEAVNISSLPGPIEELTAFAAGRIFVQDESAMLVSHLLAPMPGETIIDLCAAPGGKSTHLAELMNDRGEVISVDDHPHKIALIAGNARRLQLTIIKPTLGDARHFSMPGGMLADAVLVDAPCTGTGVLRRRVDARYRRKPEDIVNLAKIQQEILDQAAKLIRPGGRLVYSTCTLEPEEDQEQVESFLKSHPQFETADFRPYLPEAVLQYAPDPEERRWLTILPVTGGGDGFFMCRLERRYS